MKTIKPFCGIRLKETENIGVNNKFIECKSASTLDNSLEGKIKNIFSMLDANLLYKDDSPCYYICQIECRGIRFCGVISLVNTSCIDNKIHRHEHTLSEKEAMISQSVINYGIQTSPILLVYESNNSIENLLEKSKNKQPDVTFNVAKDCCYKLWVINDHGIINQFNKEMNEVSNFHLADGHHRFSVMSGRANSKGDNYVLSMLVSQKSILSKSYNRLIKLPNLNNKTFIEKLENNFYISYTDIPPTKLPKDEYFIYIDKKWIKLKLREHILNSSKYPPILIDKYFFKDILNINDQSATDKITFIPELHSTADLEVLANNQHGTIALCIPPIEMHDFFEICKQGILLPPHSTYFEPKVINGVVSYHFDSTES